MFRVFRLAFVPVCALMDAEKATSAVGGGGGRNAKLGGGGAAGAAFDETHDSTTAQNPNFVANYFASSRLHFIGYVLSSHPHAYPYARWLCYRTPSSSSRL